MLNFDFLDKVLGTLSPAHFVYDFLTKMFFMSYQISLPGCLAICVLQLFINQVVTS